MANLTTLQPISRDVFFPYLSGEDLIKLCETNKAFAQACRDDRVWESKVNDEYPEYVEYKPADINWREYYLLIISAPSTMIYRNGVINEIPSALLSPIFIKSFFVDFDDYAILFDNEVIVGLVTRSEEYFPDDYVGYVVIIPDDSLVSDFDISGIQTRDYTERRVYGSSACRQVEEEDLVEYLSDAGIMDRIPSDEISSWQGLSGLAQQDLCYIIWALNELKVITADVHQRSE